MSYAKRIARIMIKSMNFKDLKAWVIKHLKKQLKEEQKGLDFSKSLAIEEIFEKAVYPVGTIREWKGKKYVKVSQGKWMRKYDNARGKGAETALKNILKKVESAQTAEELNTIIYENLRRFKDENGKILPEVKQIYELAKKEKESTGKTSETASNIGSKGKSEKKEEKTKKNNFLKILDNKELIEDIDRRNRKLSSPGKETVPIKEQLRDISEKLDKTDNSELKAVFENFETDVSKYPSVGEFEDSLANKIRAFNLIYSRVNNEKSKKEEKQQNRSEAMKGNKNAYKGGPKEVAKYINGKTTKDSERKELLNEAFKEKYGVDKKDPFLSIGDLYSQVKNEKAHSDKWYDAINNYDEAAEIYRMVIGDDKLDYYNNEIEKERMKPNYKKEELPKSNVEMTPKQKKTFDEFGKKYIKKNWPQDRIEKFSKHNYDINGEDWTITTDGRIMLCVKEKFDEPENANKVAGMRGVFDILKPKEIETPKDIDTLIKNAPKKVVVEKDYKGKDEKQNAIIKIGDRYFSVEHLKTIQDFLGPLSNVKIEADPRETNAAKFISGDKAVVAMPVRVHDKNDKRIINSEVKEESKKKSFTPISKDKMKSMSDDELKDYEAKLEKDLLATSRADPDYVEIYNHWREVHEENNDRFHQRIEDEAKAEKQAEADAKFAKEKEIKEKYHGYFDNRSGLDKTRDLKTLEKKYNFDGKVMSQKDFVEQAIDGGVEIKEREVDKLKGPSRTQWNRMDGYQQEQYERRIKEAGKKTVYTINGYEFPKTVVDYAKYYKENKSSLKKSISYRVDEIFRGL